MRDLLLNALRRNLEAAEKRGDKALAARLRARLPVQDAPAAPEPPVEDMPPVEAPKRRPRRPPAAVEPTPAPADEHMAAAEAWAALDAATTPDEETV